MSTCNQPDGLANIRVSTGYYAQKSPRSSLTGCLYKITKYCNKVEEVLNLLEHESQALWQPNTGSGIEDSNVEFFAGRVLGTRPTCMQALQTELT